MKYFYKLITIQYFLTAFFVGKAADDVGEVKQRARPVIIQIIPQDREEIIKKEGLADAEEDEKLSVVQRKGKKVVKDDEEADHGEDENFYSCSYGNGFFYRDLPSPDDPDILKELKLLGIYRKNHLKNHNPLIVKFFAYDYDESTEQTTIERGIPSEQELFSLSTGIFVSGWEDYTTGQEKKMVKEKVVEDKLKIDIDRLQPPLGLPLRSTENRPKTGTSKKPANQSDDIKIPDGLAKITKRNWETCRNKIISLIQSNDEIKNIIERNNLEIETEFKKYHKRIGDRLYSVPHFKKDAFPITLNNFLQDNYLQDRESYFAKIVHRIFNVDIGRPQGTSSELSIPAKQKFFLHLLSDPKKQALIQIAKKLFRSELWDTSTIRGSFENGFNYHFTDSEQVFLTWLDAEHKKTDDLGTGIYSSHFKELNPQRSGSSGETSGSSVETSKTPISIKRIKLVLISYLDMCYVCRGTLSYLHTPASVRVEKGWDEGWMNARIKILLQNWLDQQGLKEEYSFQENIKLTLQCISLAKYKKKG